MSTYKVTERVIHSSKYSYLDDNIDFDCQEAEVSASAIFLPIVMFPNWDCGNLQLHYL